MKDLLLWIENAEQTDKNDYNRKQICVNQFNQCNLCAYNFVLENEREPPYNNAYNIDKANIYKCLYRCKSAHSA